MVTAVRILFLVSCYLPPLSSSICNPENPDLQLPNDDSNNKGRFVPECSFVPGQENKFRFGKFVKSGESAHANISYTCQNGEEVFSGYNPNIHSAGLRTTLDKSVNRDLVYYGLHCQFRGCYKDLTESSYLLPNTSCSPYFTRNECYSSSLNDCHLQATCKNIQNGTYTCECNPPLLGDGITCEAPNVCLNSSINDCHSNATCIGHKNGTYSCMCEQPFSGNGTFCEESLTDTTGRSEIIITDSVVTSNTMVPEEVPHLEVTTSMSADIVSSVFDTNPNHTSSFFMLFILLAGVVLVIFVIIILYAGLKILKAHKQEKQWKQIHHGIHLNIGSKEEEFIIREFKMKKSQFKEDELSCYKEGLTLDSLEHILGATDLENSIAVDEVNKEIHGDNATISEKSLSMQNSQELEEPNTMQLVPMENIIHTPKAINVEDFKNQETVTTLKLGQSQPSLEKTSHHDFSQSIDRTLLYQIASDYNEQPLECGHDHQEGSDDLKSYILVPGNDKVEYSNCPLFLDSVTPEINCYDKEDASSEHVPMDVVTFQDLSSSTGNSPLFTEDPVIDLDQNTHWKVASDQTYVQP